MLIHSKSLEETRAVAEKLLEMLEKQAVSSGATATVIGLYGDLGAGKTTFAQYFGDLLGIEETIASPTFVIEKIYKIGGGKAAGAAEHFLHLIHIDAYRIESEQEMKTLGWEKIAADQKNLILIEWPERIAGLMPADHIQVRFEHVDETTRIIEIKNVAK